MKKEKLTMIELFSGIGAQKRGIDNTELFNCEVLHTSDIDKEAILSYASIHHGLTPEMVENYNEYPSREEMIKYLVDRNIGFDFQKNKMFNWNKKINSKQKFIEKYWLATKLAKNLGDISKIEKLPYTDVLTYSFPCTDVSQCGRQAGLKKGSGTRSGLLWEVERLLNIAKENNTLPKYLLLENVKNLVQKQFIDDFKEWLVVLENLGYNTYWEVINGKYCGIPQNRERVFAISIRKDIDKGTYSFPKPFNNGLRLDDILQNEDEVEEKYYLSDYIQKQFHFTDDTLSKNIVGKTDSGGQKSWVYQQNSIMGALTATDYKQPKQILTIDDNELHQIGELDIKGFDQLKRVYGPDGIAPTLPTCQGGSQHPKIYSKKKLVRKLTPTECFRLMGFDDTDITNCYQMGVADSSLYKQAGNSIITNCIELLFEHLYKTQYDEDYVCIDEIMENFQKPQVG